MEVFPAEIVSDVPRITLTGMQSVHVEQHKGLVGYQPEEVTFRTACGLLTITGDALCLRTYTASEALVEGTVAGVSIKVNGGGKR